MKNILFICLLLTQMVFASHAVIPGKIIPDAKFYRDLTLKVRNRAEFSIPFPGVQSSITYSFELDQPLYDEPMLSDFHFNDEPGFTRSFWDRILLKDGSHMLVNGEKIPLTCIFISGQDNRFGRELSPLYPEFIIEVFLVANDYSCQGPLKPGWPDTGGKPESWGTYLYYEIRDPTIMLPTDAKLRYMWNEYNIVLVDRGNK